MSCCLPDVCLSSCQIVFIPGSEVRGFFIAGEVMGVGLQLSKLVSEYSAESSSALS